MLLGFECIRRVYFPKETIVKEGQIGEGLYIFNEGQATASTNNVVILTLIAGSHFGASIMMGMNKKVICNLTALSVCHVLIVTHESYTAALIQYPAMEAAQALYRTESEAFQELAKVVYNVQMRSNIVRDMVKHMGYEGADTEQVTKSLVATVFKAWLQFVYSVYDKREAERKTSLRRWDQQRWIFNARDGRQQRMQKEQETIQHVWPPRGGPKLPPATADASSWRRCRAIQNLDIGPPLAGDMQEDAWYLEAMGCKMPQTSREWGSERRRAMMELYLPGTTVAQKAGRSRHSPIKEDVLHQRNFLTDMLEERL